MDDLRHTYVAGTALELGVHYLVVAHTVIVSRIQHALEEGSDCEPQSHQRLTWGFFIRCISGGSYPNLIVATAECVSSHQEDPGGVQFRWTFPLRELGQNSWHDAKMQKIIEAPTVEVRPYRSEDAEDTLALFVASITETASTNYSPDQISAWARPEQRNVSEWDRAMRGRDSVVAVVDEAIAGFSDVSADGYIDMMFVSPRFSRQGVARTLLTQLEQRAAHGGARRLSADVSITARSFFERHGFTVEKEQRAVTAGVQMTNFHMTKVLDGDR